MGLKTIKIGNTADPPSDGGTKREKVQKLKEYHKQAFEYEDVLSPRFIPRLCYKHKGENIISFYTKEIRGGVDIYIEFCDRNFVPEDEKRTLWKWVYNPEYDTEYEKSDPHPSTGDRRYLIPIDELINISETIKIGNIANKQEGEQTELFEELPTPGSDVPYDAMTLRDYAAIQWKKPVSKKQWLNTIIEENFK